MSQAFQDKSNAGCEFSLSEAQKIERYKTGLKQAKDIDMAILATKENKALPENECTFQKFYNIFSSDMNAFITAMNQPTDTRYVRNVNSNNSNKRNSFAPYTRGGRGHGRGGRNNSRGGRHSGRYGGRGGRSFNRHYNNNGSGGRGGRTSFASFSSFTPELKRYSDEEFCNLSYAQKAAICIMKRNAGWINETTPPVG